MRTIIKNRIIAAQKAREEFLLAKQDFEKISSINSPIENQLRRFAVLYITKKYPRLQLKEIATIVGYACLHSVVLARKRNTMSKGYIDFVKLMAENGFEL